MDQSIEVFVEVAHPTFDFIQPRALKAFGVHPFLGVSEQREVLVNGIGHGCFTRYHVGVIKDRRSGRPLYRSCLVRFS